MADETPPTEDPAPVAEDTPLAASDEAAIGPTSSKSFESDGPEVDPDEAIGEYLASLPPVPERTASFKAPEEPETEPVAEPSLPEKEGVMYWGVTSELHMMCCEADQRPALRTWEEVLNWVSSNEEKAKEQAMKREGDLKLIPLAIVCQEAPLHVLEALVKLEPDSVEVRDKFGDMPLHRCCLQNRNPWQFEATKLLLKHNSLKIQDGWGRTPLMCALESPRGPMKLACYEILCVGGALEVGNRKGILPLKVAYDIEHESGPDICDIFECA